MPPPCHSLCCNIHGKAKKYMDTTYVDRMWNTTDPQNTSQIRWAGHFFPRRNTHRGPSDYRRHTSHRKGSAGMCRTTVGPHTAWLHTATYVGNDFQLTRNHYKFTINFNVFVTFNCNYTGMVLSSVIIIVRIWSFSYNISTALNNLSWEVKKLLTRSLIHSVVHSLNDSIINSLVHSLI